MTARIADTGRYAELLVPISSCGSNKADNEKSAENLIENLTVSETKGHHRAKQAPNRISSGWCLISEICARATTTMMMMVWMVMGGIRWHCRRIYFYENGESYLKLRRMFHKQHPRHQDFKILQILLITLVYRIYLLHPLLPLMHCFLFTTNMFAHLHRY